MKFIVYLENKTEEVEADWYNDNARGLVTFYKQDAEPTRTVCSYGTNFVVKIEPIK